MEELKQKILAVMSVVFEINISEIPDDASPNNIENWDSLRHMNLILALEDEFQFRFTDDEIVDLLDLPTIMSVIKEKKEA